MTKPRPGSAPGALVATESSSAPGAPGALGALADRYAVERELGRGGAATVYLADDLKHGRKVAIKLLAPELALSFGAERFLREISIVAQLVHPNIVPLIDSGSADGQLYYVSPYVAGGSLGDRICREGRLSIEETVQIAQDLGAALHFAHRAGFVHRDVKPANVLLADGRAMLADFGIARACDHALSEPLTGAGLAIGTPEYMSPEQASGELADTPSDTYSLACVVYEMLVGEPPIRGETAREVMARHVTEAPRPLRVRRPEAPAALEQALARALAKNPADRFPTIADFVAALRAERTIEAPVAAGATHTVAVLPFVNASPDPENEYLSDGITDELIDALAKVAGLRVSSRSSVFSLKGRTQDVRALGALLGVSVVLEGTVRRAGTRLRITAQLSSTEDGRLLWSQRYDREFGDVLAVQDEIARTIVDTLRATWLAELEPPLRKRYVANSRAYALYLKGRHAWNRRSQEGVAEAIGWFEQAIAEDPNYALAYTGLSDTYALHVDYRSVPVAEGFERAKQYALRALELDDSLAEAHASLAWTLFVHDWDWEGAEASFRRAIALDPRYATAHQWYAFLLAARGRVTDALVEAHVAQEIDPASVSIRRTLGVNYFYARRYDQAKYYLLRSIAMNPLAEESYRMLGLALSLEGRHDEAVRALREGMGVSGGSALSIGALAYALARGGHADEARALGGTLERRAEEAYVSPVAFAFVALGLGDDESALAWTERAHAERRGWLAYVGVNPMLDPLRGHPRFEALRAKMGL